MPLNRPALRAVRILLVAPVAQITMKVTAPSGEADMDQAVSGPLLERAGRLPAAHDRRIAAALARQWRNWAPCCRCCWCWRIRPALCQVQDDAAIALARPVTARLNHHLLNKARGRPTSLRWPVP
jgi:hypothetical protein